MRIACSARDFFGQVCVVQGLVFPRMTSFWSADTGPQRAQGLKKGDAPLKVAPPLVIPATTWPPLVVAFGRVLPISWETTLLYGSCCPSSSLVL
jgi:hypothetical protein